MSLLSNLKEFRNIKPCWASFSSNSLFGTKSKYKDNWPGRTLRPFSPATNFYKNPSCWKGHVVGILLETLIKSEGTGRGCLAASLPVLVIMKRTCNHPQFHGHHWHLSSGKCCFNGRELDSIISIGWGQQSSLEGATGYCESQSPLQILAGAGREMRTWYLNAFHILSLCWH